MLDEGLLDDLARLTAADEGGVLRAVAGSGAQIRQGVHLAGEVGADRLERLGGTRAVVVLARGTAGQAGDLLVALSGPSSRAPIVALHDLDRLPLWVGAADTIVALSYTGVEDDLLAVLDDGARRGAPVLAVGPQDTPMHDLCAHHRAAFLPVSPGWPRHAAFWALAAPLLTAAGAAGICPVDGRDLEAAADVLDVVAERCRLGSESFVNPAKTLALELGDSVTTVWGTSALTGVVAHRLATQLAGCAATPAVWGRLPDAAEEYSGLLVAGGHDEDDLFRDRVEEPAVTRRRLVLLRDPAESPRDAGSADAARDAATSRGVGVTELRGERTAPLGVFASLLGLCDFASVYLGLASGVDLVGVPGGPGSA